MSRFPDALRSAMNELDWTQTKFTEETAVVSRPTLSRYLSGTDTPKPETLDQICRVLPPHLAEEIAAAYVTDQIPESAQKLVMVVAASGRDGNPVFYEGHKATPGSPLAQIIAKLEKAALDDRNLLLLLDYLGSTVDGKRLVPDDPDDTAVGLTQEEQAKIDAAAAEDAAGTKPKSKRARYGSKGSGTPENPPAENP